MLVLQEIMMRRLNVLENNLKIILAMKVLLIGEGTNECTNKWLVNTCGEELQLYSIGYYFQWEYVY